MDIAALGLSVDSGPLSNAVQELRQVVAAARSAAAGADQVVGAAERMARAMTQSTTAANQNVRALQVVGSASRAAMQQMANSFAGVRDFPTESPIAYGRALDELRAKYNPLFAAGRQYRETLQDINVALKMGAISEKERSEAIARTKAEFVGQVAGINTASAALRGNANALRAVAIQIPDVIQGITMGQSGFQIFTEQGLQIVQVLGMQPGGIGGAFKELSGWVTKFVTPARLAAGGILAIGAAALTAAAQYQSAQRQMSTSLLGSGRASGATVGDLNQAASAGASTFGLSISEAREFAATLAQTGKVGVDEIGKIIKVGHDVATVYGIDATEAAKLLAQSFSDPVRGAENLNERLGFLSARMQSDIASLVAQNRLYEAQRLLLSGVASSVDGASASLGGMAKGWTAVGNAISNAWNKLGEWTARAAGLDNSDVEARLQVLDKELQRWQQLWDRYRVGDAKDRIRDITKEIEQLTAQQQKAKQQAEETQANINSLKISDAAKKYSPEIEQRRSIENDAKTLRDAFNEINRTGGENSEILKRLAMSYAEFATAVNRAEGAAKEFKSEYEKTIASLKLDISAVGAKGPAALGNLAYQRSLLQSGSNSSEAVAKAELDRTLAIKQAQQQILDTQKARLLSAQQATETAKMEAAALGKSVGEQEAMRGKLAARQQLEQEALQTYGNRDAYDRAHLASLEKEVEKQAAIKQLLAEQQLKRDVKFQTETLFMAPGDQQIASTLRNAYGDNKWKSEMDGALAQQMRMNNALVEAKNAAVDFTASMIEGFAKGEDMAKVLENALTSLSSQLIKMGSQNLIGSLFQGVGSAGQQTGGLLGGGLTSLLGLGAAASGGVGALAALGIGAGLSFLGANSAKKQAQQQEQQQLLQAQKAWAGMTDEVTKFTAEMRGVEFGKFANKVISAYNQFTQLAEAANAARDYGSLNQLRASFARFFDRTIAEFRDGVPVLGRVGDAVRDLHNEAESLWEALSIVSGQSADAAVAIQAGLARSLADLTKQVNDELVVKINELTGKGYLNKLGDLFVEMADLARDPALADISQTYFKAAAQDIVNSARLTGDAFNALIEQFPQLQGVVTAFVADAQDSADRLLSYQDRLFSAVTDASTLKGALAAFQRTAQQEIESELAQGGQAINALVAAQEAERFNIIKEFSDRTEKVVQGYKDRLFAATTDTSTLAGALAAFDRTAMREREEEIKAGGESINVLVAAQEAERYNIIKSFSERAAEAQKQALDEATNYLQNFSRRIREYLDSLTGGSQSPLSPTARLSAAQSQFNTQRALAAGGDRNALDSITTYASNLIDAAQAMYGSTTGFQSIFSTVQAQLGALPSQVRPEDVIVQAIETQTTDLETGVLESIRTYLADHLPNIDLNSDNAISLIEMQTALGGSYSTGTLRSIFNELDNDGNGLLTKAELRGTAATDLGSVKTNTGDTKTNTNNTATNTNNTANRIGSGAEGTLASILTSMQTANNTAAAQLELLNGQLSATSFTAGGQSYGPRGTVVTQQATIANNMLTALNKIVWNTWVIAQNTYQTALHDSGPAYTQYTPLYAEGGLITGRPHSSGGVNINAEGGEYVVNKRDTAWALPMLDAINYGHRMPANDNSGLLSELRALRAEVAALRRDNARVTVAAAEHVRDGIDESNAIHAENNKRLRRQAA